MDVSLGHVNCFMTTTTIQPGFIDVCINRLAARIVLTSPEVVTRKYNCCQMSEGEGGGE